MIFIKNKNNNNDKYRLFIKKCISIVKKCNKHTGNTFPKKIILISENKIKEKSRCAIVLTERTFIDEIEGKYHLESELEIYLQFFTYLLRPIA